MKAFTGLLGLLLLGAVLGEESSEDWIPCAKPFDTGDCFVERKDNNFAGKLYNRVCNSQRFQNKSEDFVISPLGVSAVLGTLIFAVGPTSASEIDSFLYPQNAQISRLAPRAEMVPLQRSELTMATVAMVRYGLYVDPEFVKQARELDSYVYRTRFIHSDVHGLNEFIQEKSNHTTGLDIIDHLRDLNPLTRLIFYNSANLKADLEQSFRLQDEVMVAQRAEALHGFIPKLQARVLGLRLKHANAFLLILLPHDGAELSDVEENLATVDVRKLPRKLNTTLMDITLPHIDDEEFLYLRDVLQEAGINTVFNKTAADLTAFRKQAPLDNVLVSTKFHLTEDGINTDDCKSNRTENSVTTEPDPDIQFPGLLLEFNAVKPLIYAVVDSRHVYTMGRYFPQHKS